MDATNLRATPFELPGGRMLRPHGTEGDRAKVEKVTPELGAAAEDGHIALTDAKGRQRHTPDEPPTPTQPEG
jgi:hypothetical protein